MDTVKDRHNNLSYNINENNPIQYYFNYKNSMLEEENSNIGNKSASNQQKILEINLTNHLTGSAILASIILDKFKYPPEMKSRILKGILLHDIGKLDVSRDIILKTSRLTESEFSEIKKHPIFGYKHTDNVDDIVIRNIILLHHEKEDGSGYPFGLKGDKLPSYVKIATVCDIADALLSKRSYKEAWEIKEVKAVLTDYANQNVLEKTITKILLKELGR